MVQHTPFSIMWIEVSEGTEKVNSMQSQTCGKICVRVECKSLFEPEYLMHLTSRKDEMVFCTSHHQPLNEWVRCKPVMLPVVFKRAIHVRQSFAYLHQSDMCLILHC